MNKLDDSKTLQAIMFITVRELAKTTPNDQELGARVRKLINNFEKDLKSSEFQDLMTN